MPEHNIEQLCQRVQVKVRAVLDKAPKVEVGVIDDAEIATYAAYNEFGAVQRVTQKQSSWFANQDVANPPHAGSSIVLPPRPFIRATVDAKSKSWSNLMKNILETRGVENLPMALQVVGTRASEDIKQTLIDGGSDTEKFPERSSLTMELYEAQSRGHRTDGGGNVSTTKPMVKTGALLNAIGYQIVNGDKK